MTEALPEPAGSTATNRGQTLELSVVIPCFNGVPHIRAQLDALANAIVTRPWEVIVADNGSTDGSAEICAAFAGRLPLQWVDASDRKGQSHARNVGARRARGHNLIFLDQDDVISTGYLAKMTSALDAHPFVAGTMDYDLLNPRWAVQARGFAMEPGLRPGLAPWAYGCVLGMDKGLFEQLGGFDEDLPCSEDMDLCWRAQRDAGAELHLVEDALLHYRLKTSTRGLFAQGMLYGRGGAALYKKWRQHGMPRRSPTEAARSWMVILWRMGTVRDRAGRAQAWYLLGQRLGCLTGSIRERVLFL